jgi:hypothetical protein
LLYKGLVSARAAGGRVAGAKAVAAATEERFEKVAKAGAAKLEVCFTLGRMRPAMSGTACIERYTTAVLPIWTEFVVATTFFRIAQDFIRFVDFLELRLSSNLVFGYVGMIEPGQFSESQLDLFCCG